MGILVVSLDFELRWGVQDRWGGDFEGYRANLEAVHENVPWMLKLFAERGIGATWATVGALGCEGWEEFLRVKPALEPSYDNPALRYFDPSLSDKDPEGRFYFAPHLVRAIVQTKGQELGLHTFGHIYATEPSVSYAELREDLLTAKQFFVTKFGCEASSLVYPRNQVIYPQRLRREGIIATYRGNESAPWYAAQSQRAKRLRDRARILWDAFNPMSAYAYRADTTVQGNVPASAMLRLYLPDGARALHLAKIKRAIARLREDEVYHVWFHPHNLGTSPRRKEDLEAWCDAVAARIATGRLVSRTMGSFAKEAP